MQKLSTKFYPNESNNISKRSYTTTRWDSSQVYKDSSTYTTQSMSYTTLTKRKVKNHRIISIDAKKAFDKVQHPFMIKTLTNVSIDGTHLTIIKAIMINPQQI